MQMTLKTILSILALLALGALLGVLARAQAPCIQQDYDALSLEWNTLLPSAYNNDELGSMWRDVDNQLHQCDRAAIQANTVALRAGDQGLQEEENRDFAIVFYKQCHPSFWWHIGHPLHRAPEWCKR
jgi:hypothetical protein